MRRKFYQFILAEVLASLWAVLIFRLLSDRIMAAVLAGLGFVSLGLFIVHALRHHSRKGSLVTYWLAWIHLFVFSIPMLTFRLLKPDADFSQVHILWWTGPQFHGASEMFFLVLVVGTIFDCFRAPKA